MPDPLAAEALSPRESMGRTRGAIGLMLGLGVWLQTPGLPTAMGALTLALLAEYLFLVRASRQPR